MIHVIATIDLHEGKREAFLQEFHRLVPLVRAEAGCLEYGPTADEPTTLQTQLPVRPNGVTVIEKWESLEALYAHIKAPHMADYRIRVKDLVKGVQLQVLRPV